MTESLGILGYDSFHYAVENLDRSRAFYVDRLGLTEVARATEALASRSGQTSTVFAAGDVRVVVSTPTDPGSRAGRFLSRHPAGVMSLSFVVEDLDRTVRLLESRGGTLLDDPLEVKVGDGSYRSAEIATPLGDVGFRFVERKGFAGFAPEIEDVGLGHASRPENRYGITSIDHVTSNGLTMQPIVGFYRDVLGMEPFWDIEFHTRDVNRALTSGSGLRSVVMWDPESGVKFATNEPLRPFYRQSQIWKFVDDNHGNGVQHVAFAVKDILFAVEDLAGRGVEFMATHPAYYRDLPERLRQLAITNVKEDLSELERLGVLVDGAEDKYMLQIFLREAASLYEERRAGPFFYEIIQRAGDPGFGYGNFRALFESIERAQKSGAGT